LPGPADHTVTVATALPWSSHATRHGASAYGNPAAIACQPPQQHVTVQQPNGENPSVSAERAAALAQDLERPR
jgi:hypothetical protein